MQNITVINLTPNVTSVQGVGQVASGATKTALVRDDVFDDDMFAYRDRSARIGIIVLDSAGILVPVGFNSVTGAEALVAADRSVVASTSGADYALTLMAANAVPAGTILYFYFSTGANTVTITRAGADTIDGGTTLALNTANKVRRLQSDGVSAWTSV